MSSIDGSDDDPGRLTYQELSWLYEGQRWRQRRNRVVAGVAIVAAVVVAAVLRRQRAATSS